MNTRTGVELTLRERLTFAALGDVLHGLEADIEQGGLTARYGAKAALDRLAHFAGLFDLFTVAVESPHQLGICRARRDVQTGKVFRLDRPALRIISRDTRLLRKISLVVKHHREKRQIVLLHCAVNRRDGVVIRSEEHT